MGDVQDLIERLFDGDERLPAKVKARIVALGEAAVAPLMAIAGDDALLMEESRGDGMAPVHALALLGELRAEAAIPRMIAIVAGGDADDYAVNAAALALRKMGAAALEPCLAAYAAETRDDQLGLFAGALAELGVRDERVWQILLAELEREPVVAAMHFAEYGDARALPLVSALFDREGLDRFDIVELAAAIERLGGALTPAQARLRAEATRRGERSIEPPGRNDPCHCGSGKKYKKCHLESDQRGPRASAATEERSFTRAAFDEVVGALMDEAAQEGTAARDAFFGSFEPSLAEWGAPLCLGYLLYGRRDDDGRRCVDRFAARRAAALPRQQRGVVKALETAWASLFAVTRVRRGGGLVLRDLVGGETIDVRDETSSLECEAGDTLWTWIFDVDGHHELLGDLCLVPEDAVDAAREAATGGAAGRDRGAAAGAVWQTLDRLLAERAERDEELDELGVEYDASQAPDGEAWELADESERTAAVQRFHQGLEVHPPTPNPRLHAIIHVIVENQLGEPAPNATRAAMARLRKAGLSRHEALHAVGMVVTGGVWGALGDRKAFSTKGFERALAAVGPGEHAGSAPR